MADMIDTRDLKTRLEELQTMAEDFANGEEGAEELDDSEQEELAELIELENEVSDWQYGATLIPEDSFQDYARELAEDIGAIPDNASWPLTCIDWSQAAAELESDYTHVTYQGITYLVRD